MNNVLSNTPPRTSFIMPDCDVVLTPNWIIDPNLQYLTIDASGAVKASDKLKAMTADTPVDLVIPSEINGIKVTSIGDSAVNAGRYAFQNCTSLVSVTIPESVTIIEENAFPKCTSLTSVNILGDVKSIPGGMFTECTSLVSVNIPTTVTDISFSAFKKCTKLSSITIYDNIEWIASNAFLECTNLKTINIHKPANSIDAAPWGATNATINWLG